MKRRLPQYSLPLLTLLFSGIVLTSGATLLAAFPASWPQEYLDSLAATSKDTTQAQISKNLIAVLPGEPNLTWNADNTRVLMETWADNKYYGPVKKPGDTVTVSMAHLIWVSSPPELKQWVAARAFAEADLTLRLKQMLGMPPDADKTQFVDFWVKPADLVRPSPDPEINDHEASLDFPVSPVIVISDIYKNWFNNLISISYTSDTAHPWTRLGYTYDWGNEYDHVGISEFTIWDGAQVEINAVTETANYVTISPTVIDLGTDGASAGDHIVISACVTIPQPSQADGAAHPVPPGESRYDVYVMLTAPWGKQMSLLRNGAIVRGIHPYVRGIKNSGERVCQTLLDYTVSENLPTGVWAATVAVLPADAPPIPAHVRTQDRATVMIE
ncbi:MAG: hypothetical protein NTX71_11595 [Candidatus Aureabacteria bacterium]|nr:hypothetical protein [Candidatus Auribacterota bacterium]